MTGVAKSSGFTGEFRFGRFAALAAECGRRLEFVFFQPV